MTKKVGRPPNNGRRAMTAAERQRMYRRRKKALAKQREVTVVTGAGQIAVQQVRLARPVAVSIADCAIKLGEELRRDAPSLKRLLRLAKALNADAVRVQTVLDDFHVRKELETEKPQPRRRSKKIRVEQRLEGIKRSLPALPPGLKDIEDTLHMDHIVCLEDGQVVRDLAKHLETLGMSPDVYRKKWKLPDAYPMQAPAAVLQEGVTFVYEPESGTLRRVRT